MWRRRTKRDLKPLGGNPETQMCRRSCSWCFRRCRRIWCLCRAKRRRGRPWSCLILKGYTWCSMIWFRGPLDAFLLPPFPTTLAVPLPLPPLCPSLPSLLLLQLQLLLSIPPSLKKLLKLLICSPEMIVMWRRLSLHFMWMELGPVLRIYQHPRYWIRP